MLTWALLNAGYRIGHCEDACLFTNAQTTLKVFVKQRQCWARGMIEAFIKHPSILIKPRLSTFLFTGTCFPVAGYCLYLWVYSGNHSGMFWTLLDCRDHDLGVITNGIPVGLLKLFD